MSLESRFNQAVVEWIEHSKRPDVLVSSSVQPLLDCDAYRGIVAMGSEVLPLILRMLEQPSEDPKFPLINAHGLAAVVREIVGPKFSVPDEIKGRVSAMGDYTRRWLD